MTVPSPPKKKVDEYIYHLSKKTHDAMACRLIAPNDVVCDRPIAYRYDANSRVIHTCDDPACRRTAYDMLARETDEPVVVTNMAHHRRTDLLMFVERLESSIAKQTEILRKCKRLLHNTH